MNGSLNQQLLKEPWTNTGRVPVRGGTMRWATMGSGPPIVLMPKLGGWIADWRHVAPLLAEDYQVIAIDPLGHGGSVMSGAPPFIISQQEAAATVMMVLDTLGIGKFVAVGNSMGGSILLTASMIWPDRISKLCLVSTALPEYSSILELEDRENNKKGIYHSDFSYEKVDEMFSLTRETYEEFVLSQNVAGEWKGPSGRGVAYAGLMNFLPRSTASIMLLYGELGVMYSRFAPEAQSIRPDIRVEQIPGCGSFAHQDQPSETYAILEDFLK